MMVVMESNCAGDMVSVERAHCGTQEWQQHLFFILQQRDAVNKRVCTGDGGYGQRQLGVLADESNAEADYRAQHGNQQQGQYAVELGEVVAHLHVPEKINFVSCEPEEKGGAEDCRRVRWGEGEGGGVGGAHSRGTP